MDAFYSRFRGVGVWGFCLGCVLMMGLVSCSKPEAPQPETASAAQPAISPELAHIREQIEATQKKMEALYPQLMAVETAARANHPEIKALFEDMTAKRNEYQVQLNSLPEMKQINDDLEVLISERMLLLDKQYQLTHRR